MTRRFKLSVLWLACAGSQITIIAWFGGATGDLNSRQLLPMCIYSLTTGSIVFGMIAPRIGLVERHSAALVQWGGLLMLALLGTVLALL